MRVDHTDCYYIIKSCVCCRLYPDLPPPTYTESQWGPADIRREADEEHTGGDFQFVPRYVTYTSQS